MLIIVVVVSVLSFEEVEDMVVEKIIVSKSFIRFAGR